MSRLVAALAVLVAHAAFAQFDDVVEETTTIQVPGVKVKVKTQRLDAPAPAPAPAPGRSQPPPRVVGAELFSVEYGPMNGVPSSAIKVVSPEGASAEVWNEDGSLAGSFSVPFNFSGRHSTYYRFILTGGDGSLLLDKKLELKQFIGGLVKFKGASAPAPVAAPAQGMADADFAALVAAVDDAGFGSEKLGVIETAAQSHVFSIEQVGKLVDLLGSSDEKVGVVERTRAKIVDKQNGFKLLEHFSFSADKEKVRKLLK